VFKHHVVGRHVKALQKSFSPSKGGPGFFCFNFVKGLDRRISSANKCHESNLPQGVNFCTPVTKNKIHCKVYEGFFFMKKCAKVVIFWWKKSQKSPYLDNEFLKGCRWETNKKFYFALNYQWWKYSKINNSSIAIVT